MESQNVPEYSLLKAIPFSFFSGALYRDVAKNWKGTGFAYLILVLALVCVPRAVKLQLILAEGIDKDFPKFLQTVPDFKFEKGQLSLAVKQPIYSPSQKAPVFVVDTTGKITSLSQVQWAENTESVILVTKTKILTRRVRFGVAQEQTVDLNKMGAFKFDKESLGSIVKFLGRWSGWIAYPFLVWGFFVYNMAAVAVYGLIGLGISKVLNVPLDFVSSMRLSVVSHTPSLALAAALFTAGVKLPIAFWIFLILSTFFLFLAVRAAASADSPSPS